MGFCSRPGFERYAPEMTKAKDSGVDAFLAREARLRAKAQAEMDALVASGTKLPGKHRNEKPGGTIRVTSPGGKVTHHPDDGRDYPAGTMLQMDIGWTVTGGGWPFDD